MKALNEFLHNPLGYIAFLLIGCVGYLFYDNSRLHDTIRQILQVEQKEILKDRERMIEIIERNTFIIQRLDEKLEFTEKKTKRNV